MALKLFTPIVRRSSKCSPPWFTSSIRHNLNKVHILRRRVIKSSSDELKCKLAFAERDLATMMEQAKCNYEEKLDNDFTHRCNYKIYRYIDTILHKDSLPQVMYHNTAMASDERSKATQIVSQARPHQFFFYHVSQLFYHVAPFFSLVRACLQLVLDFLVLNSCDELAGVDKNIHNKARDSSKSCQRLAGSYGA